MSSNVPDSPAPQSGSSRFTAAASNYIDERTKIGVAVKEFGRKVFPDHWSFLLGEVALYSFVVILLSGTFLTLFFQATMIETHYTGPYVWRRVEMSGAMASTLDISFSVRGGLLMRQIHHWAALLFVASIGLHMLRILHRCVPQASAVQLGHRLRAVCPGDGRGLHRLLTPPMMCSRVTASASLTASSRRSQ